MGHETLLADMQFKAWGLGCGVWGKLKQWDAFPSS